MVPSGFLRDVCRYILLLPVCVFIVLTSALRITLSMFPACVSLFLACTVKFVQLSLIADQLNENVKASVTVHRVLKEETISDGSHDLLNHSLFCPGLSLSECTEDGMVNVTFTMLIKITTDRPRIRVIPNISRVTGSIGSG